MKILLASLTILIPQLLIDLLTMYLSIRRSRRGKGASGVPLISLFLSILAISSFIITVFFPGSSTILSTMPLDRKPQLVLTLFFTLITAILLHWILVFLIPEIDFKIRNRK